MLGDCSSEGGKVTKFSVICCSNDMAVLNQNLLSNYDIFKHDLIIKFFPKNICAAYNEAVKVAKGDYLIFAHQDICLPETFFSDLSESIDKINERVCGAIGPAGRDDQGNYWGWCNDRGNLWGSDKDLPKQVQTLDEMMLVIPREHFEIFPDLVKFDENIENQHLFGADICMTLESLNKTNYAVSAFCMHNSKTTFEIPKEFFFTAAYLKKKWGKKAIYATCAVI